MFSIPRPNSLLCRTILAGVSRLGTRKFSKDYLQSGCVYVHWPYCARKCVYCDFNKYVVTSVDHQLMNRCIRDELATLLHSWSGITRVRSVYFGGGTPSLAQPAMVQGVLECIGDRLCANAEVTLEINPASSTPDKLDAFCSAGVNRLSIGTQTFDDAQLAWMGRDHTSHQALRCLKAACGGGRGSGGGGGGGGRFSLGCSADLIFGLPDQSLADLSHDIDTLTSDDLGDPVSHVSLYQLTVKRGTALYSQVQRGQVVLPAEDLVTDMYLAAVKQLQLAGFERYEVSNFCRPGRESVHNSLVWQGGQYIGVGPGAHSRLVVAPQTAAALLGSAPPPSDVAPAPPSHYRVALVQTPNHKSWSALVQKNGHGVALCRPQSTVDMLSELLYTSLRTHAGLSSDSWRRLTHNSNNNSSNNNNNSSDDSGGDGDWPLTIRSHHQPAAGGEQQLLEELMERGLCRLEAGGDRLVATDAGLLLLDSWTPQLLNWLDQQLQHPRSPSQTSQIPHKHQQQQQQQ